MMHLNTSRKSTKVLISTPSNGEPGRLDWSAQLLKLLPRYATEFSTSFQLQQYRTRVQQRGLVLLFLFEGIFMTSIFFVWILNFLFYFVCFICSYYSFFFTATALHVSYNLPCVIPCMHMSDSVFAAGIALYVCGCLFAYPLPLVCEVLDN